MNPGAVFGIILAIMVMGYFLVFGSKTIQNLFCLSGQADIDRTIHDLQSATNQVYDLAEGSGITYRISVPSNTKFCFLKPDDPSPNPARDWRPNQDTLFKLSNNTQAHGSNIWYDSACAKNEIPAHKIPRLIPDENFCISRSAEFYLENAGDHVRILE